jgi:hypothetical protein
MSFFQKIIEIYEDHPPQGLSEARRGSVVFPNMLTDTDPPRGRPVGGGGVHRK